MLKYTRIRLELLTTRICCCCLKIWLEEVWPWYLTDTERPIIHKWAITIHHGQPMSLNYLDANNLYEWAMAQLLLIGGFEWVHPDEINEILEYSEDHKYGTLVESDLDYPQCLHGSHNDYPLSPEAMEIYRVRILVHHLGERKNYTLPFQNFQYYIFQGMILKKIQRWPKKDSSNHQTLTIPFAQTVYRPGYQTQSTGYKRYWERFLQTQWITKCLEKRWRIFERGLMFVWWRVKIKPENWCPSPILIAGSYSMKIWQTFTWKGPF